MQYKPFTDEQLVQWSTLDNPTFTVHSQQSVSMGLQYNITDRWRVSATMPYDFSFDNREGHTHSDTYTEVHDYGDVDGWGDATFIGSYDWLPSTPEGWQLSTGLGIKAPTGQTQVVSSNGVVVDPHLQPGTGSWDPVAMVRVKKPIKQWTFTGDVYGKIATTANDHNMGDYVSGTVSSSWKWWEKPDQLFSSLSLFGAVQSDFNTKMMMPMDHNHSGASDTTSNIVITTFDNSGFTRIFISGGTYISIGKHVTIPLSISVPVFQHLNGYQVKMQWKSAVGIQVNI
ncbi:MAG: hypothetical protein ACHQD9_06710, partial [Chitinophagales bacterium]